MRLKAPFPYFGGKSRIADEIWARFGELKRYIDPFCGSLAVPLAAPIPPRAEIFNDVNGLLVNAWRAIQRDPEGVWYHAMRPQAEIELNAIHRRMREVEPRLVDRLQDDPAAYDVRVAGWWVWGMCASIGSDWQEQVRTNARPHFSHNHGILSDGWNITILTELSERLQGAKIACGDYRRVLTDNTIICDASPTNVTGVFLDPPYSDTDRHTRLYGKHDTTDLGDEITDFCLQWGDDARVRIILCGYDGEYPELEAAGWKVVAWSTSGGYGNQGNGRGRENKDRERLWCSPHTLEPPKQLRMFE